MSPALRQPLSRQRAEVLDVVRDHGPAFAARDVEDNPVAAPGQVLAVGCLRETSTAAGSVSVTQLRTRYGWLATVSWPGQGNCRPGTGTTPRLGSGR